jgi:mannitol-specific phosphotransferase system IIBC component
MYENIIVIHNVFFKKNYIVKFSTSSIFKKISKDNFEKKIKKRKKRKKKSILNKKTCKKKQKQKKKDCCYNKYPTRFVSEYSIIIFLIEIYF